LHHIIAELHFSALIWRRQTSKTVNKEPLFIEKNAEGKFAIKRANTQRASAICDTQSDAIERAKKNERWAYPR
jgi:Uncharacterized protein conserved in bacteria (DUF2188)